MSQMLQGKHLWTTPLKEKHQGAVYTVESEVVYMYVQRKNL